MASTARRATTIRSILSFAWLRAARRSADDDVMLGKARTFPIGQRTVTVHALTIDELKEVSGKGAVLIQQMAARCADVDLENLETAIPAIVEGASDGLEQFLGAVLKIEPAYLTANLTLPGLIEIVEALVEVNQVPLLVRKGKALWARLRAMAETEKEPSQEPPSPS